MSLAEGQMGNFLTISGINEHTSSASAMEKTGKLLSSLSYKRFKHFKITDKIYIYYVILFVELMLFLNFISCNMILACSWSVL